MRIVLAILLIVSAVGCSKSGGGSSAQSAKPLASMWTRTDGSFMLDLNGLVIGVTHSMSFVTSSNARCSCNLMTSGTEASGNYALTGCTWTGGGGSDPGCSSINGPGTWSKPASILTFCDAGGCVEYK